MEQKDIIRMVREAGWSGLYTTYNAPTGKPDWQMVKESLTGPVTMEQIERFAALVAAEVKREASFDRAELWLGRINKAVAAEREACAKVCEDQDTGQGLLHDQAVIDCAAAIRARGEQ